MSTAIAEGYGIVASTDFGTPVDRYGVWDAQSKHWIINFGSWLFAGNDHASVDLQPHPDEGDDDGDQDCLPNGSSEDVDEGCVDGDSPIVIDVGRNGYKLTSVDDGVFFDLDADGVAERVSWTDPASDDAWLAMDRNRNGRIDDGRELFGNQTPAYPDQQMLLSAHGFDALKFLEGPDFGRSDGNTLIEPRDSVFSGLLLWHDRNHNGISEPNELQSAAQAGLAAISTDSELSKLRDRHGNEFRQKGRLWWNVGNRLVEDIVYDVWLVSRR